MMSGSTYKTLSLRPRTNSLPLPPEHPVLFGDRRVIWRHGASWPSCLPKGTALETEIFFFPLSENRCNELGRWTECVVRDSPGGTRSSRKYFTHPSQRPPWEQRTALAQKRCVLNLLRIELSISVFLTSRDSLKVAREHCCILKIKLILNSFQLKSTSALKLF